MSIPAKRNFNQAGTSGLKTIGQWPVNRPQNKRARRAFSPNDSDSGSEPWIPDIAGDVPNIQKLATSGALDMNTLTVLAVGSETAVLDYSSERKKRNHGFHKNRHRTARECVALTFSVTGCGSLPGARRPPPHTIGPDDYVDEGYPEERSIPPGDFLHVFLKYSDPDTRTLICTHLDLCPPNATPATTQQSFRCLLNILSTHHRDYFNHIVHNPSRAEIEDLLEHINLIGHKEAALEFYWLGDDEDEQAKIEWAKREVAVFVRIVTHLIAPWSGPKAGMEIGKDDKSFFRQVKDYWKGRKSGVEMGRRAGKWALGYERTKRVQAIQEAVEDGLVPSKAETEEMKAAMIDRLTKMVLDMQPRPVLPTSPQSQRSPWQTRKTIQTCKGHGSLRKSVV
ncbi:hypothetical protein DFH27DRAFT_529610 [Peziza echinospora]|nr:hypothetical protein DFH27DRAFT_529610 [Peziza echinospora]